LRKWNIKFIELIKLEIKGIRLRLVFMIEHLKKFDIHIYICLYELEELEGVEEK